ncbi:hypothetical protein HPC49_26640 [Pyxidicoccus fallax]|uniref:Lipoprotein n=1 Tax=Pyxidicoccus fallax TaxID=394095 RepID=A0A848LG37_9BACT|nr:hypothetical protein [Pyxidicoccus fallax]NMO16075.1 hypothetical protein [Pyxidicoccus fallax]NPC81783.1 hypothetical protein [Pyxidicoccus fallax]
MSMLQRSVSSVVPLFLAAVLSTACGEGSVPEDKPRPGDFRPTEVPAKAELAQAPGFADQSGGGVFVSAAGSLVRLRLDGSLGALAPHPGNTVAAGRVEAVFRLGPHSALVKAENGLFLAESGWVIAPPWRTTLAEGSIIGTAQSADGAVWLAHTSGLYRLQEGTLAALKAGGGPLTGITSLAAAPTAEGSPGVWFLREGRLYVAVATGATTYQVREANAPLEEGEGVESLAGLGPGVGSPGELWLLTNQGLLRRSRDGWRRVELDERPSRILGAGRFLWAKAGGSLLLHDAETNTWGRAADLDTGDFDFLAVDESGCAWVRLGGRAVAVSRAPVPRVLGLYQGMQVVEDGLVVRAVMPPGTAPTQVFFQVDGKDVPTTGPEFSLGGLEADGTHRAYSFAGLSAGRHVVAVVARFEDGTEAKRTVPFDYQPLSTEPLSWAADIRPIYESRCKQCHETGPARALNTYELWKANAALITASVRDQRMPADGPMDPQLITRIQRWAASGARP